MVGVLLFFFNLVSWIMAMCMLCLMMKRFSSASLYVVVMQSVLNWSIFMLRRVVYCKLYVV